MSNGVDVGGEVGVEGSTTVAMLGMCECGFIGLINGGEVMGIVGSIGCIGGNVSVLLNGGVTPGIYGGISFGTL